MSLRLWFDDEYLAHLKEEITYLRNQVDQARIENTRLQQTLNQVTPAGRLADKLNNPQPRPVPAGPQIKRWAQIEAERYALIEENRKKLAEVQSSGETHA